MSAAGKHIFFSYGHDCADIVEDVRRCLEERGHSVWVDTLEIKAGRDWREEITKGILESDLVLAFLSWHALREGGVCLSELAIAVGCRYGRVRTVLLEPGIESMIPSTISGIQYYDLSAWREMEAAGGSEFEDWRRARLDGICDMVEEGPSGSDAQLEFLSRALSPNIMSSRRNTELLKPFIQRGEIEQGIGRWLGERGVQPFYLLVGPPGFGKSAFMAHFSHYSPVVTAAVFCEWGCANYLDTRQILKSIAYQVAAKVPTYRTRLASTLEASSVDLARCSVRETFDILFLHPTYGDIVESDIVVVIDGLDEASADGVNELSDLLSSFAPRIPRFLRFILTTAQTASVLQYFGGYETLDLEQEAEGTRKDVIAYLEEMLASKISKLPRWQGDRYLRQIAGRCEGSFLYAELLAKTILQNDLTFDAAARLPVGINGIYFDWMQRSFPGESIFDDSSYDALCVIAASRVPLPTTMLLKLFGLRGPKLRRFLRKIQPFFTTMENELGETCVRCFHSSFLLWVCGDQAGKFELDIEEGLQRLAEALYASFEGGSMSSYEVEEMLPALSAAGMEVEFEVVKESDDYIYRLIELGREYEAVWGCQERALGIYRLALGILEQRPTLLREGLAARASLLCAIGRCQLAMGYYQGSLQTLTEGEGQIEALCVDEERMSALSCLGSLHDWRGDRAHSVECFERLLELADEAGSDHWRLAAMSGLVWNDHFSNLDQALERLDSMSRAKMSDEDRTTYDLCAARVLLSAGRLDEALSIYERCLDEFDFGVGADPYSFHKNRLLLVETLPACYDTNRMERGIELGRKILRMVEDQGWLEESYCSYWLACLCTKKGDFTQAEQFLERAAACNGSSSDHGNSAWMTMNVEEGYGHLALERGDYTEALTRYASVREMALGECRDPWVAGDACFTIFSVERLFRNGGVGDDDLLDGAIADLERLARDTGLVHLRGKAALARAYERARVGDRRALADLREAREVTNGYRVASLDRTQTLYCELRTVELLEDASSVRGELAEELSSRLEECATEEARAMFRSRLMPTIARERLGIDAV